MAITEIRRDQAFPYGLVPFGLYFLAVEFYVATVLPGRPTSLIENFFATLFEPMPWSWGYAAVAFLEIDFWLVAAVGLALVIVALMRSRVFRAVLVVWLLLPLLYAVLYLADDSPRTPTHNGLLLGAVVLSCAGVIYALLSKRLAAFFNR